MAFKLCKLLFSLASGAARAKSISAALLLASTALSAHAQWPDRPIVMLVPTTAGGSPDVLSRLLANQLTQQIGQSVVIENRPGASGGIAMSALARATPDGYTIAYGTTTALAINQHLFKKLPYSPEKDFDNVVEFIRAYNFLLVPAASSAKSVKDLVEQLRAGKGEAFFASSGNGTTGHLSGELFKQQTGMQLTHVPFTGSPAALNEVASGRIHMLFDNTNSAIPLVQAGKLRILAVTSPERLPQFPEVPTMIESGLAGFEVTGWGGVIVPEGTPRDVIAKLNSEINKALQTPALQEGFRKIGAVPAGGTPEDMKQHIVRDSAMWAAVIKRAHISLD